MGKAFLCKLLSSVSLVASSQLFLKPHQITSGYCPRSGLQVVDQSSCPLAVQTQPLNVSIYDSQILPSACIGDYCVYSNPTYAGGRGIALVSTPQNAESIAKVSVSIRSNDYSDPPRKRIDFSPPYYITEIPGKGVGVVANQTIRRGTRIMAWTPALVVHGSFSEELDEDDQYQLLDKAVEELPSPLRQTYMAQLGHFGGHKVDDILNTNAFNMALGTDGDTHLTAFPEVSRFNHDCRPNIVFHIDNVNLVHYTYAGRDIQIGEELTLSYLDEFRVRKVRRDRARRSWGFVCTCPQCMLSDHHAEESDKRLLKIWEMEEDLADINSGLPILAEWIEKVLRLYKEERLDHRMADAYSLAAMNYNAIGDAEKAKNFAALSLQANLIENGPKAPDVAVMRELGADPEGHWTYRKRVQRHC